MAFVQRSWDGFGAVVRLVRSWAGSTHMMVLTVGGIVFNFMQMRIAMGRALDSGDPTLTMIDCHLQVTDTALSSGLCRGPQSAVLMPVIACCAVRAH